ncbi:hypothetical protein WSK_3503 [Novosphingobium sp. Rr 2-17]|uniref:hypothetical protein n=1 Tax=Novosphingobium sp. Rr 2-17 TaxID=555793 RepID=UPI000269A21D|nr:hypothetical protein [Novosphingobium sp. Rr 2-17]EIZ77941.1 hypothetical protein WSK_3503 [Novosphingobium sp. Rr 2-17]
MPASLGSLTPDPALADLLIGNASSFRPDLQMAEGFGRHIIIHHVAIAIELALKAYLARAGIDDDRQRQLIGHDLDRALKFAEAHGLVAPPRTRDVVELVHPYFMQGGFHREKRSWPGDITPVALDVIDELITAASQV